MDVYEAKSEIIESVKSSLGVDISNLIFYPEPKKGHLSIRLFSLPYLMKESMDEIASKLSNNISRLPGVKSAVFENGYLNLIFEDNIIINSLCLHKPKKKKTKVVVEYPSVNPNKPWHIGHLRNALIGESVSRILEENGYEVERLNYINDLGLQVAESFFYYSKFGNDEKCEEKFDHCVGKQYVKAHKLVEEDEVAGRKARELLKEMEKGDDNARKFVEEVLKAQYITAENYSICSDRIVFESDLSLLFEKGLDLLKKNKAVYTSNDVKNKGCMVVQVSEKGNLSDEKILVRSDGTLTYTGKDIIFHLWKLGKLSGVRFSKSNLISCKRNLKSSSKYEGIEEKGKGDLLINIIGIEQSYPQKIVRDVISTLGYDDNKIIHLAYSFVRLKDKRFSGRKGTWIGFTADELLSEGISRVISSHDVTESIAKKIALAAIKFAILKISPKKEVIFDWDRVLSTEGDSGVYLLYSYVRANSILLNSNVSPTVPKKIPSHSHDLVLLLIKFNETVKEASSKYDPSLVSNYLLSLSRTFHKFYSSVHVIGNEREGELLYIISRYKEIMRKGLYLLGIDVVERM